MSSIIDFEALFNTFSTTGQFLSVQPFGSGHINDTFLIKTQEANRPDYIFQRINNHVFTDVTQLMSNIAYVTDHIRERLIARGDKYPERHSLTLVKTQDKKHFHIDEYGQHWAVYIFINGKSYDLVESTDMAYQGGKTYGRFLDLLADVDTSKLHETIPNFHNVRMRLDQLKQALHQDQFCRKVDVAKEIDFVLERANTMQAVLNAGERGDIPLRVTHNDTKFNNILLDQYGEGLCVIDLDTVMPGYLHYDYSDAIRTATNSAVEDETDLSKVDIDLNLFDGFCRGFIQEVQNDATETEFSLLANSTSLLPYLIGLRFLTDYINGDVYFKTHHANHNLERARCQFKLVERIETKMSEIQHIIHRYAPKAVAAQL